MNSEVDVLIAGGGVMGSACAYFLQTDPAFRGSIAVVEPDPSYANAASTRSASSIRQQFSTPVNIALSVFGMDFLKHLGKDVGLVQSSYLQLATLRGRAVLERCVAVQRRCGVAVQLHERAALESRYPWLNVEDLAAGSDTSAGEGWFDGYSLLSALRRANEDAGVQYRRDRVLSLERSDSDRITAMILEEAGRIGCGYAVNATGTRSRELALTAHIDLPVVARKRTVFVFTCPSAIANCPLVIDPGGLWFRREGDRFLCGIPAVPDPDVSPDDFEVALGTFDSEAWPVLAHRVPAFEQIRLSSAWAGHYDYNTFDQNAFVGPVPGIPNLLLASGFSGHGLQHSPGIGRALAEYIRHGEYRSLDLAPLSFQRYLRQAPLRETVII